MVTQTKKKLTIRPNYLKKGDSRLQPETQGSFERCFNFNNKLIEEPEPEATILLIY